MNNQQKEAFLDKIVNADRNKFDSPFKNLLPLYEGKIAAMKEGKIDANTFWEIYWIRLAEKIYYLKLQMNGELNDIDYKIDISQLKVGDKYKSYADLCRALNQPDLLTGKQRQNQTKRFKRFIDWKKTGQGNEIEITKKYMIPKAQPLRNREGAKYIQYVECLILAHLYNCAENKDELSQLDLLNKLGFTNCNFRELEHRIYEKPLVEVENDIYKRAEEEFVADVLRICYQIIYRAIKSLENRKLLCCEKMTVIDNHVADIEEQNLIREVELGLLQKYGFNEMSQVYASPKMQRIFFKEKNRILYEKYNWKYIYLKYRLKSSHNDLLYGIKIITNELRNSLNCRIVKRMKEELNKKKELLESDINTTVDIFNTDYETGRELFDIVNDTPLNERETFLRIYDKYISQYIQLEEP